MARPRKQYTVKKHIRIDKKTGVRKESNRWNIHFKDHLEIKHRLTGTPDKSTTEYIAKNRKTDTIPLRSDLAEKLQEYFQQYPALPHTKLFSKMWKSGGYLMLKHDLENAGIPYKTKDGIADFHALRHTFGTLLAQSGVMPQDVQKLMRHSDINLTMNVYTHLRIEDKSKAVNKLPPIEIKYPKQAKTGTCDTPENLTANLTENPGKIRENTVNASRRTLGKAKPLTLLHIKS